MLAQIAIRRPRLSSLASIVGATLLLLLPVVPGTAADPHEAEAQKAHEDFQAAWNRNDADAAGRFMSEDLVWVGTNGLRDRSTVLDLFRRRATITPIREQGMRVRAFGDAAVITAIQNNQDTDGRRIRLFTTEVWAKTRGEWKLVSLHLSEVPQKEPK
jgi:ketosteroid isomerase-like protein